VQHREVPDDCAVRQPALGQQSFLVGVDVVGRDAVELPRAERLEREGVVCVEFPQNDQRMAPASERLYNAIVDQRLTLPDDPELARTRRTRPRSTRAADGGSPSPTTGGTSTASSPSRWPSSVPSSSRNPWNSSDGFEWSVLPTQDGSVLLTGVS
jgi:hypothetical protein